MFIKKLYRIGILPYAIFLFYSMIFGFGRTVMDDHIVRFNPISSTIAFIEYGLLWNDWKGLAINLVGNIVMFMPFGFLGWVFPKFYDFKTLLYAFLMVLISVEALQYFSRRGVMEVADILFNSFGLWLGFLLFLKFNKKWLKQEA